LAITGSAGILPASRAATRNLIALPDLIPPLYGRITAAPHLRKISTFIVHRGAGLS